MQIQYKLTFQDFYAAQALHARRGVIPYLSRLFSLYGWMTLGLLMCIWSLLTAWEREWQNFDWVNLACSAVLISLSFFIRRAYWRQFNRTISEDSSTVLDFNPELIFCKSAHAKSDIEWAGIQRTAEDKRLFLLYTAPGKFITVPKRALVTGQVEELRALLEAKVSKNENRL